MRYSPFCVRGSPQGNFSTRTTVPLTQAQLALVAAGQDEDRPPVGELDGQVAQAAARAAVVAQRAAPPR